MKKIITEGEMLPKYYGLAYPELWSRTYVCYPFPINHLVRILRTFWLKIRNAKITEIENNIISDIENKERELLRVQRLLRKDRQDFEAYKIALLAAVKSMSLPPKE